MTRILVVEDEASFSDALSYVLGKEGFEVTVADTGDGAIAACLLYTSPSPRDRTRSRMPSSA